MVLCSASAQSVNLMILGRFLVGIGIGVNTGLVPMYISEVLATPHPKLFLGNLKIHMHRW